MKGSKKRTQLIKLKDGNIWTVKWAAFFYSKSFCFRVSLSLLFSSQAETSVQTSSHLCPDKPTMLAILLSRSSAFSSEAEIPSSKKIPLRIMWRTKQLIARNCIKNDSSYDT